MGSDRELANTTPVAPRATPARLPGRITYVVGDIHGRFDLFLRALDLMSAHLAGRLGQVIILGDLMDRGPQSREVIEYVMDSPIICLRGNHEQLMINGVQGVDEDLWLMNGGGATLESYGGAVPETHVSWLKARPCFASDDHRVYVHGGLEPSLPTDEQDPDVMIWIRERFLRADAEDFVEKRHIVHGHTPRWAGKPNPAEPELLPHRTNLDTGAFFTGVLTIGVFDADRAGGPIEILTATDTLSDGPYRPRQSLSDQRSEQ